ncbi:pickpocket protein 28-like [Thrips palmi]|uniref:Pickpocket protein 28-like n=1 Tax=Thrips palmi TaxID=161013 RepID=A0A6P9AF59_THRPL|nr:pickpocket protein 28-like [Thrips palmi]
MPASDAAASTSGVVDTPAKPKALGLRDVWREFCRSTTMHGLRYLVDEGRTTFDKAFWGVSLLITLVCCTALLVHMYERWLISPAMATNELKMQAVWEVPFPAVTICPDTKFKNSVFNLSEAKRRLSHDPDDRDSLQRNVDTVLLHCDDASAGRCATLTDDDTDFLTSIAPQIGDTVRGFQWRKSRYTNLFGANETGFELWTPILTDEGLCFSFNILSPDDLFTESAVKLPSSEEYGRQPLRYWNLSRGYSADAPLESTFPARAMKGAIGGLGVLLFAPVGDMDYTCRGPMQGFKIAVHSPAEVPQMQQRTRSMLGEELLINVKPSTISTSEELRYYKPQDRRCFFPEERQLEYFKVYTKRNCELECSSNFSRAHCGCVAFFMPRSAGVPVCGPAKLECLREAAHQLEEQELVGERELLAGRQPTAGCNCLADCVALEYDVELYRATFDWERSVGAWIFNGSDFIGMDCARVTINVKDNAIISNQRSELYSLEKFIAACAGVLGLFTGFSLINIIEAAFFVSWGLVAKIYHKAKHALCRS